MKRDKIVRDHVTINFRIDKALKSRLNSIVSRKNITLSKYLRDVLEKHLSEFERYELPNENQAEDKGELHKEFFQFVIWLYTKKEDRKRLESDTIDSYIKLIKRLDGKLPSYVIHEFDKVLIDLFRIKSAIGFDGEYYNFPNSQFKEKKLDYKQLEQFFLNTDYLTNLE